MLANAATTCARPSDHLTEIDRLEDEGDRILREGLTALFEGGVDPMVVIRWKDIFERVEEGSTPATAWRTSCAG